MRLRGQVIGWLVAAFLLAAPPGARATVVEPLPPPGGTGSVGSLTYVTSLDHLVQLTREDDLLHPRALALARDSKISMGVLMGGIALGALIMVGAATVFQQNECITPSVPPGFDLDVMPICQSHVNKTMAIVGLSTSVVGALTGMVLMPSQTEVDIINDWNARHPDRTLLVVPSHHHHHHHH